MFTRKSSFVLFLATLTVVQLACNAATNSRATPDTFATLNNLYTASALTLTAGATQPVFTSTPGLPLPTYSPGPPPTSLPLPTATNLPVFTPLIPTARCDAAEFVKDVTYPDGSPVPRNTTFEKTWRIRNIGTCIWTTSYSLIFDSGHRMSGPSSLALPKSVSPGGTIDISVTLTAPANEGNYLGYWKLQNANGANFGIGDNANKAFWVEIKVPEASYLVYSFVANYCDAEWNNGGKSLPCPGANGDLNGFVLKLNNPAMENGVIEDDPGLLMTPPDVRNGVISGEYPAFTVQDGDRFRTIVSCQRGSRRCDVVFQLDYKNNGKVRTLFSWNEVYEGEVYPIDFDLSPLAGETVKFILIVGAHGGQNQDNAIWLHPFILRQGSKPSPIPPTRTFTPTLTVPPTWTFTPTITLTPTPTLTVTPTSTPTP